MRSHDDDALAPSPPSHAGGYLSVHRDDDEAPPISPLSTSTHGSSWGRSVSTHAAPNWPFHHPSPSPPPPERIEPRAEPADAIQPVAETHPDYDPFLELPPSYKAEPERAPSKLSKNRPRHVAHFGDDSWLPEILSLLFSVGCLAATAVILATTDGKALSQWHMPIRPNAMVSVFATVTKAALVYPVAECIGQFKWLYYGQQAHKTIDMQRFDDASRGPWGSLLLLSRLRGKGFLVPIGCLITILAMAVDPFAQQIISFPSRTVPSDAVTAFTQRAQAYDSGSTTRSTLATAQQIQPGMQGAILMGVYGIPGNPSFTCSTGNCTFPDMPSLGVCGSCKDVTADSQSECGPGDGANILTNCNFTSPSGFRLTAVFGESGSATTYWTKLNSVASTSPSNISTSVPRDTSAHLISFAVVKGPEDDDGRAIDDGRTISECSLRLCERTYKSFRVVNGKMDTPSFTTKDVNSTSNLIGNVPTVTYLIYNTLPATANSSTYVINGADYTAISSTLVTLFNATLYSDNAALNGGGINAPDNTQLLRGFDIANALYGYADLSELVDNVSHRMSDFMQSANATPLSYEAASDDAADDDAATAARAIDATANRVSGTGSDGETYVHVSWLWFILPAGLVLAAALFLLLTILANRSGGGGRIWKSSSLPYLYHPLAGETLEGLHGAERLAVMRARARATSVRLARIEDGQLRLLVS